MNATYLEQAKERMPNIPLLVNVISKRVRQLNAGQRPLIKPDTLDMDHLDLALKEVAEGKLSAELGALPSQKIEDTSDLLAL
ncbi:MAG: DNA-directed RNA polymerase subunit omega [Kiritimatiellae bacterium]|jgi:DNA-directed RNA polymerase subunit omega|nr:DNA-directed RNA polymerase subunit omega [Kiritimatiellia bacterium]MDD4341716.1 DNA-directed RNA polymerase subunit omega [Kiritimatiellia bacterium]MDY0149418.1 DNA-directed RNA polymerase subunit omega [Kiritimatiellia bacterium]